MSRPNNIGMGANSGFTEEALCAWVGAAAPGDSVVYHRGFLAIDGGPETDASATQRTRLLRLASRAMRLCQQGFVHLVQRREAERDFTYIAVACPRPLSAVGALKSVMVAAHSDGGETATDAGARGRARRSA